VLHEPRLKALIAIGHPLLSGKPAWPELEVERKDRCMPAFWLQQTGLEAAHPLRGENPKSQGFQSGCQLSKFGILEMPGLSRQQYSSLQFPLHVG